MPRRQFQKAPDAGMSDSQMKTCAICKQQSARPVPAWRCFSSLRVGHQALSAQDPLKVSSGSLVRNTPKASKDKDGPNMWAL